ncbi:MAG: hypothetical protein CSA97_02670 [Bacteroidetes bacterium]|nr:MAG: hypothetical protein CSA97_02670 [Bacteroidota bacterium]
MPNMLSFAEWTGFAPGGEYEENPVAREHFPNNPKWVRAISRLAARAKRPMVEIELDEVAVVALTDSKFGGVPYLPFDAEVPTSSTGEQLALLAQVNCEQLPANGLYPERGILQFWIGRDEQYGLDEDDLTSGSGSCVIYHKYVNEAVTKDHVLQKYRMPTPGSEAYPMQMVHGYRMIFTPGHCELSCDDYVFNPLVKAAFADEGIKFDPEEDYDHELWDKFNDCIHELFLPDYVRIGGFPAFCDDDPRPGQYEGYTVPLLAIGSHDLVEFADLAEVNFLIRPDQLEREDFRQVLYYWDELIEDEEDGEF